MPGLPGRPDLGQLRRQARELLRGALGGEPGAVARLRAVSERVTLSAAQLAIAREYGCPSWSALRAEVERLRGQAEAGDERVPGEGHEDRWSFLGGDPVETSMGVLSTGRLAARPGRAAMVDVYLAAAGPVTAELEAQVRAGEFTVADDGGTRYRARVLAMPSLEGQAGAVRVCLVIDPVPGPDARWLELCCRDGSATRLLRSPQAAARVGELLPMVMSPAERALSDRATILLSAWFDGDRGFDEERLRLADGAALGREAGLQPSAELDPAGDFPAQLRKLSAVATGHYPRGVLPLGGLPCSMPSGAPTGPISSWTSALSCLPSTASACGIDRLVSGPGSWQLYLRATPRWSDPERKAGPVGPEPVSVYAEDDRGGAYISARPSYVHVQGHLRGSAAAVEHPAEEAVTLRFRPRFDPLARTLKLTFRGINEKVTADLDLGTAP